MKIFKGFLKLIVVLVCLTIFFSGAFIAMISFSSPAYYTEFVENEFIENTGQKLIISGGVEFKPSTKLNTTFTDSTITLKTNIGEIKVITQKLYLGLPWMSLFRTKINSAPIQADQLLVKIEKNNKLQYEYAAPSFSADIHKSCCDVSLNNIQLLTKSGILMGRLLMTSAGPSTIGVHGNLHADQWTLDKPIDPKSKILAFESADNLEGTIDFTIDKLITPQGEMNNVEAVIDLAAKTLTVKTSHVTLSAK